MRRDPIGMLALFLALCATALAGGRLATGAQIAGGSLTRADVRDRGLRAVDLVPEALVGPRGATGPTGSPGPTGSNGVRSGPAFRYGSIEATIAADGTIARGALGGRTRITHPAPGVYCFEELYVAFVNATSAAMSAPQVIAAETYRASDAPPPCPAQTSFRVAIFSPSGQPADGAFHLLGS